MLIKIDGVPRPEPKYNRTRNGRIYQRDPKGLLKAWKENVRMTVKKYMAENNIEMFKRHVPIYVWYYLVLPRPKSVVRAYPTVIPDNDNYRYSVTNALKGILWEDDCHIIID